MRNNHERICSRMEIFQRFGFVILIIFLTISLTFAFGKASSPEVEEIPQGAISLDMKITLSKHQAVPGDTIWFVLHLANSSNDTLKFLLPSPMAVLFRVFRNERLVWRSDYGLMFAQIMTPFAIPPKDSIELKSFFMGKNNDAKFLPLGKYIVEGCFTGTKECLRDSFWLVD